MTRVDELLQRMEDPSSPLETTISSFEEAMSHIRRAQAMLQQAEQRVRILVDGEVSEDTADESNE